MHQIEKWWAKPALHALGRAFAVLQNSDADTKAQDLAKLAFCRSLIKSANVSFGHQSMSFAAKDHEHASARQVSVALREAFTAIAKAASVALPKSPSRVHQGDARSVAKHVGSAPFGTVITSPPYANRMSYVRELRPYMYWLGYLEQPSDAGELDWQAIGGTWGSATSRVAAWQSKGKSPLGELDAITLRIAKHSDVLARYVAKYFVDMLQHVEQPVRCGRTRRPGSLRGRQLEVLRRGLAGRANLRGNLRIVRLSRGERDNLAQAHEQARAVRIPGQRDQALTERLPALASADIAPRLGARYPRAVSRNTFASASLLSLSLAGLRAECAAALGRRRGCDCDCAGAVAAR